MWLTEATVLDVAGSFRLADVEISDGRVCSVAVPGRRPGGAVDGSGLVVIPGLVNGHFHGGSSLFGGLGAGMQIHDWADHSPQGRVQAHLLGWLDAVASRGELETIYRKEYLDLLGQGVTFVADSGLSAQFPGLAEEVMTGLGLRGSVECYGSFEIPPDPQRVGHSLHFPEEEDLDEASLAATVAAAGPRPVRLTGHCLETPLRRSLVENRFGQSTVRVLDAAGLLNSRTVLFHGCLMDQQDAAIVAAAGASIVHCPVSNLLTGGRVAPLRLWIESGVTVALGTDWADTDFWGTVRAAPWRPGGPGSTLAGDRGEAAGAGHWRRGVHLRTSRPGLDRRGEVGRLGLSRRTRLAALPAGRRSLDTVFSSDPQGVRDGRPPRHGRRRVGRLRRSAHPR